VPYEAYGTDTREGIAAINRPGFVNQLAGWLASIPDVDARLRAQPPARVADLACGTGWSSVAIARAYPEVNVDAIDADAESIEDARRTVAAAGLGDRVHPTIRDASDTELGGPYDLVTIFEALHDMNHPVQALCAARAMLAEHASVVISDERVAERFTAPGDELERSHYGWSVVHCLPVGMIDQSSAGTGAVIRPDTVRAHGGRLPAGDGAPDRARIMALLSSHALNLAGSAAGRPTVSSRVSRHRRRRVRDRTGAG
jgi:SAM-dependent methyltransferase